MTSTDTTYRIARTRLLNLLQSLGSPRNKTDDVLDFVLAHYTAPERAYHCLAHITDCLVGFDFLWSSEKSRLDDKIDRGHHSRVVELALWYHDLAYDPKLHNNEELSCAILRAHADDVHLDRRVVEDVCKAIMATRHKESPVTETEKWVVDIDLNILRTPEPRFDAYERQVRQEYDFVDDAVWIAGRTKVLQGFLDREWIYSTTTFRKFEGDARANIKRSLARLAEGEVLR